jgi:S-adenosylmethionine decarboxylase
MIGHHIILDLYCNNNLKLKNVETVQYILNKVVSELTLLKVSESYKQFEPYGATGFILLEESHISIHTWPEFNFAAIDVFSCKPINKDIIIELLSDFFETNNIHVNSIQRGSILN